MCKGRPRVVVILCQSVKGGLILHAPGAAGLGKAPGGGEHALLLGREVWLELAAQHAIDAGDLGELTVAGAVDLGHLVRDPSKPGQVLP
jgi:hypothetical protein